LWDESATENKTSSDYPLFPFDLHYSLEFFGAITAKYTDILEVKNNVIKVREKLTGKIFYLETDKPIKGNTISKIIHLNDPSIELQIKNEKLEPIQVYGTRIDKQPKFNLPDIDMLALVEPRKSKKPQKYFADIPTDQERYESHIKTFINKIYQKRSDLENMLPENSSEQNKVFAVYPYAGFFTKSSERIRGWLNHLINKSNDPKMNLIQHGPRIDFDSTRKTLRLRKNFPEIAPQEDALVFLPDGHTIILLNGATEILIFMKILTGIKFYNFVLHPAWQQQIESLDKKIEESITANMMKELEANVWFKSLLENKNLSFETFRSNYLVTGGKTTAPPDQNSTAAEETSAIALPNSTP
jgi:hypothetical protein